MKTFRSVAALVALAFLTSTAQADIGFTLDAGYLRGTVNLLTGTPTAMQTGSLLLLVAAGGGDVQQLRRGNQSSWHRNV